MQNYSSETSITYSNIKNLPNISQSSTSTGVSNMEAVPGCAATQEESNATTLASIENMEVEKVTRNQEVPSSGCHNETHDPKSKLQYLRSKSCDGNVTEWNL